MNYNPPPIGTIHCPYCGEPGLHGTPDKCVKALEIEILKWKPAVRLPGPPRH